MVFYFKVCGLPSGEHQMELLDFVAAKFHEEGGVFKLLVSSKSSVALLLLSVPSSVM